MRAVFAGVMAAGVILAAGFANPAGGQATKLKTTEEKLKRPDLTAKEWKRAASGLETWDEVVGTGKEVQPGAKVKVHYTGWLTDEKATIFDSSVKRGEPIEFGLNQVIKGWGEGIPGMKVGGTRVLRIPADLAYGNRGAGGLIGPGATLVFRVELLDTK